MKNIEEKSKTCDEECKAMSDAWAAEKATLLTEKE